MNDIYLAFLILVSGLILVPLSMQLDLYFRKAELKNNPDDKRLRKSLE